MVATAGHLWRLSPSLVVLMNETDRRAPQRSKASDGSIGDAAHASRDSDHNPKAPRPPGWVDAVDITDDDANGCDVGALAHHLVASKDQRIKYLIHKGTIWKAYPNRGLPAWAPQPYTGPSPHTHHLHVSIVPEGRTVVRPWWPPKATAPKPPTVNVQEDDMAAPPFTLHLDSRNGKVWKVASDEQSKTWITGPTQQAATNSLTISQTRLTAFGFGAGSPADYSVIAPATTPAWHNWLDNIKTVV